MNIELDRRALLFQQFGLTRIEARILHTLIDAGPLPLSAREIERIADLRQPEVSIGTKLLLGRGWIQQKYNGRGVGSRSHTIYVIISNIEQIYIDLYREYSEKENFQRGNMYELKCLMDVE